MALAMERQVFDVATQQDMAGLQGELQDFCLSAAAMLAVMTVDPLQQYGRK